MVKNVKNERNFEWECHVLRTVQVRKMRPDYSRVWNKCSPLNKHSPLENLAKIISIAPFFTLCYGVRNKAVAPG